MLQSIRERAQGVIAWIIVGLITIPFALFGINEYLGGGSEAIVATVNGHDITEREFDIGYREFRQQLRERMGKEYRPDLLDEAALRREVLDSMIQNTLVAQRTRDFGLRIGDDLVRQTILGVPSFKVDGQFDQQAYERGVRRQGLTPAGFEEQVRQGIVSR
ncbi:MAG: peptidylprolyl isomerase, partial [Candidatus Sedimenticola endophacoides]